MKRIPLLTILLLALLCACSKPKCTLPTPNYSRTGCQIQGVHLNFASETYSLNGMPFESFNQKITGWIPAEDDPTFYLISYHLQFCDHLELNIEDYTYQLESIGNPDGYWYEITTTTEIFEEILAGRIIEAKFEKWTGEEFPTALEEPAFD